MSADRPRPDHWEEIGILADRVANLAGALKLPLAPALHLKALEKSLPEIAREMRRVHNEATGTNPWEFHEPI